MKARLYQFIGSPFCAKVRKILDFKGVETEVVEVDYIERMELAIASGQIMVPALTIDGGETIVDSARIAERLEQLIPEPTILPPDWRGMHLVMADYIDNRLEEFVYAAALADELQHHRRHDRDQGALWRLIRERRYGAGFVDRTIADHEANWARARAALAPFETQLQGRAFLMGRIGLADFCLYGQLFYFAFTGENKIPLEFVNLRAFFDRIDRISSKIDASPV